ncbi:hypothetical protein HMPREF1602_01384 [Escherichia coli 907889]|nr:hypothetical protein HMPREF9346_03803 [Escherichia coli MS 119-7]ESD46706.1 hypothetical protein HMPREF1602_01384 [Escherichia coli 907889]
MKLPPLCCPPFLPASDALSRSSAKLPEPPRWFAITDLRLGIDIILHRINAAYGGCHIFATWD